MLKPAPITPLITLLIPVYNEAAGIVEHLQQIQAQASDPAYRLQLLVIDDGSTDGTAALLDALARRQENLRVLHFTRNFGKEAAIEAGLDSLLNDTADESAALVLMDSDLQHPPALVPQMVRCWQAGSLVVEGCKRSRGKEPLASRLAAGLFYGLFQRLAGLQLAGHSDFKLLDRQVAAAYQHCPERQKFLRGLIPWLGYPTTQLPFDVPPRQIGRSQWRPLQLLRYGLWNLTTFSSAPLSLIFWLGLASLGIGSLFGLISLYQKLEGQALDGFTTVILLVIFFGGLIMLSLGVIGHYLARIFDELKARPRYVIRPPDRPSRHPAPSGGAPER